MEGIIKYRNVLRRVERGEEKLKTKLAWLILSGQGGVDYQIEEALSLLKEQGKKGDPQAMWMLGLCKEYGVGIEQDSTQAKMLYTLSRDKGNTTGRLLASKNEFGTGRFWMDFDDCKQLRKIIPIAPWTTLDLRNKAIGEKEITVISQSLKRRTSIVDLNLNGSAIGSKGVITLTESLKVNSVILYLLGINLSLQNIIPKTLPTLAVYIQSLILTEIVTATPDK